MSKRLTISELRKLCDQAIIDSRKQKTMEDIVDITGSQKGWWDIKNRNDYFKGGQWEE